MARLSRADTPKISTTSCSKSWPTSPLVEERCAALLALHASARKQARGGREPPARGRSTIFLPISFLAVFWGENFNVLTGSIEKGWPAFLVLGVGLSAACVAVISSCSAAAAGADAFQIGACDDRPGAYLQCRWDGAGWTEASTVLQEESRPLLSQLDRGLSRTKQAATARTGSPIPAAM